MLQLQLWSKNSLFHLRDRESKEDSELLAALVCGGAGTKGVCSWVSNINTPFVLSSVRRHVRHNRTKILVEVDISR